MSIGVSIFTQNWYKSLLSYTDYRLIKYPVSIQDGRQKSKMERKPRIVSSVTEDFLFLFLLSMNEGEDDMKVRLSLLYSVKKVLQQRLHISPI